MKKIGWIGLIFTVFVNGTKAQRIDTTTIKTMGEVMIQSSKSISEHEQLPAIKDNIIYAGKKTDVIQLEKLNADLSINNTRQVFAKVAGISVWENDGSGIQVGVAARGLNPNRSWEFNVRQNGYDIASESFGYPEVYYTPPMEALSRIEVVRGAASLQYGPQFGGLLQYQIKKGHANKPISLETQQTIGSYGLFNSFNALGGTYQKLTYYSFLHYRNAEGWRDNSRYKTFTGYASMQYALTKKISIGVEYTGMSYASQQPGGLTDAQFQENARQSSRARNWFGAPFQVVALNAKWDISSAVGLSIKSFVTIAERNSVGFLSPITVKDSINPKTMSYAARQVDRDAFNNYGIEIRLNAKYAVLKQPSTIATGVRWYQGNTERNQLGKGSTGMDFDLTLQDPTYGRSLSFETKNYAVFAENIFQIGSAWKIVPGFRFEYIDNSMQGYINTTAAGKINPIDRIRRVWLFGVGTEYQLTARTNIYANYSRAYRPVTFSEMTPSATTEVVDPNLKDADGFNADAGYRGTIHNCFSFDVGLFYLQYNNRIGSMVQNGNLFKTNIGTSVSKGVEAFAEWSPTKMKLEPVKWGNVLLFVSASWMDARYISWNDPAILNDPIKGVQDKEVEYAPDYIYRYGLTYQYKNLSLTCQASSVGKVYTDAINTEVANATGTIGRLAGYHVVDVSMVYKFMKRYQFKAGVNNATDARYATRRAGGYPGPGLLPGNAGSIFMSIGASF